ncbi:MAG: ATP-binding protein [Thermoleophilia bacterium]|nr:ATP-binding protein [Thermoleophilia bacterium]
MANGFAENGNSLTCPLGRCDGGGWILGEDNLAYKCDCLEPRLAKARNSGINSVIPARYRGVSFDRPPVTEIDAVVVNAVRDWLDSLDVNLGEGHGLWLMGDTGTGKTTLAMLVSKETLKAGHSVAIYSLPKLLARIRATFDAAVGEESYSEFFERLCDVDLLHIDDLGAEKQTEWVLEQLYALINERYERKRPIVVTTNLSHDQLEAQIGERTVSRLVEICGEALPLMGEDARLKPRLRNE